jgi:hypothetical protein
MGTEKVNEQRAQSPPSTVEIMRRMNLDLGVQIQANLESKFIRTRAGGSTGLRDNGDW